MRIRNYLLLFVLLAGCDSNSGEIPKKVLWDFYKKNLKSEFVIDDTQIPFYETELELEKFYDEGTKLYCVFGKFVVNDSLNSLSNTYLDPSVPVVHSLCYEDSLYTVLKGYYFGGSAYVDKISQNFESEQDLKLSEVIDRGAVIEFLEKYPR